MHTSTIRGPGEWFRPGALTLKLQTPDEAVHARCRSPAALAPREGYVGEASTMPKALVQTIDAHHRGLLRALDQVEALVVAPTTGHELAAAIEAVRRKFLAHELTAERFVVGPLRHLHLLDDRELDALGADLDQLSGDAVRLISGEPDAAAVAAFVRGVRDHIERKTRAIVPAARSAVAEGRLAAVPRWYVEEVYGRQGGPGARPPEEWLG